MLDLRGVFSYWESAGVFEIFLPFILVFSIVFAVLENVKIFGEGNKKGINAIIALSLAILVANNVYIRELLHRFLPNVAFFMVLILVVIMLVSTMSGQAKFLGTQYTTWGLVISILFVIWSLLADNVGDLYNLPYWLDWGMYIDVQTQAVLLAIAVFFGVYFIATRSGDKNPPAAEGSN